MLTFYVILTVTAAAIVAVLARPASAVPAKEILAAGDMRISLDCDERPNVEITCQASGRVIIVRRGIRDLTADGACSLAVVIKDTDINIEERLTVGRSVIIPVQNAVFDLGFVAPNYYHVHYNSSKAALWTAFTLHVHPGLTTVRMLQH